MILPCNSSSFVLGSSLVERKESGRPGLRILSCSKFAAKNWPPAFTDILKNLAKQGHCGFVFSKE